MTAQNHVIVIGAGIGGLSLGLALRRAGHHVTILEKAKELSEVGAGIQLAPNATRILEHLGVLPDILEYANRPSETIIRRYQDDSEIGPRSQTDQVVSRFGNPMLVIHRADLQRVLSKAAIAAGANLRTSAFVQDINPGFAAEVTLDTGEMVNGDVLIGADGINSLTRKNMVKLFGVEDACTPTGDCAYRITIPRAQLLDYPEILLPLDQGSATRWIGPDGHVIAYALRGGALYNVVMVHKSDSTSDDDSNLWTRKGNMAELSTFYGNWSPMVLRLAKSIDAEALLQWPLNKRGNLPSWCVNRTALLGDACHPMLPYVAQGAAQAIEDAVTLATCLSRIHNVPHALSIYEGMRKTRAEFIQGSANNMRPVLHYVDGPEQEERDRIMRAPRVPGWRHPDLWADPTFQDIVWGYDMVKEAEVKCNALGNTEQAELETKKS